MRAKAEEQITIYPPKPFWNLKVQLIISIPFIVLGIVSLTDDFASDFNTKLTVSIFLLGFLLMLFGILYFTQHTNNVTISKGGKLKIFKKKQSIKEYNLDEIRGFVSKIIKRQAELPRYELVLEKYTGEHIVLFKPDFIYSKRQWDKFSEKLSIATEKPFKKEFWGEDYEGKLSLIPAQRILIAKKQTIFFLFVPLSISFVGAVGFKLIPTAKSFLLFGLATVLSNIIIFFLYAVKNKAKNDDFGNNYIVIFGVLFSMIIPFVFQYLLFVFILMGFSVTKITKIFY
jgi:hypothetical protein